MGSYGPVSRGTNYAKLPRTVTSARRKLSTLALLATMLAGFAAPMVAAEPSAGACAARKHDCGRTVQLKPCCCGPQSDSATPSGPIVSALRMLADDTPVSLAPAALVTDAPAHVAIVRVESSPPRTSATDLPTLFAALLI